MYQLYKKGVYLTSVTSLNSLYRAVMTYIEHGDTIKDFTFDTSSKWTNFEYEEDMRYTIEQAFKDYVRGIDCSASYPDFIDRYEDYRDYSDDDYYEREEDYYE
jgi:hypothetical protein